MTATPTVPASSGIVPPVPATVATSPSPDNKPCPFCRFAFPAPAMLKDACITGRVEHWIGCLRCGARGGKRATLNAAVAAWNERAIERRKTDLRGKTVAIAGHVTCISRDDLLLQLEARGAKVVERPRNLHGVNVLIVGATGVDAVTSVELAHRSNKFQSLGPHPSLIEVWNEQRVDEEFPFFIPDQPNPAGAVKHAD
jgi:hypothetical protein